MPKKRARVYETLYKPWADEYALRMRLKYGINVWVDGTVTTGWKIFVHYGDLERARNMFQSVVHVRAAGIKLEAYA